MRLESTIKNIVENCGENDHDKVMATFTALSHKNVEELNDQKHGLEDTRLASHLLNSKHCK